MTSPAPAPQPVRVLVVEDDPELQYLLRHILAAEGRRILVAGTARGAEAYLTGEGVDMVVLDLILPDADGRTLLRALRHRLVTANVPAIALTARPGPELRAECFELGADAVVEKPFDPERLAAEVDDRLTRALARPVGLHRDRLTGLWNLAGLLEGLEGASGRPRALVLAEIDGLGGVAERLGWGTAGMIATEVGRALGKALAGHPVARTAGGEYGVLVESGEAAEAEGVAVSLLDTVRKIPVRDADGETFRLTASAAFLLDAGEAAPPDLLDAVRARVQRVGEQGGNRLWKRGDDTQGKGDPPLILLAEDDDITAKILTHRLQRDAFRVLRFDNGQDAYRGALSETPALVVLDVKMPGMDGFEVLARLRKTPSYARVPVMMLTSMGSEADVVRGFDLGADDYMLKPFSPTELLARIRRLLRRGHTAA